MSDSLGRHKIHEWNAQYEVTRYTDYEGRVTDFAWNQERQLLSIRQQDQVVNRFSYDEYGNLCEETDAHGHTQSTHWHPIWSLPVMQVDALGHAWKYVYDESGNLVQETDPLGAVTTSIYNPYGQVVKQIDALGGERYFFWNTAGLLQSYTDCSGSVTTYTYDAFLSLQSERNAVGDTIYYSADRYGRLQYRYATDYYAYWVYQREGQLAASVDASGARTDYQYDAVGRLSQQIDACQGRRQWLYDAYDRLTAIVNENGEAYEFTYNANDELLTEISLDGSQKQFSYNPYGDIETVTYQGVTQAITLTHRFVRDPHGRVQGKITPAGATRYYYDANGQLLQIKADDPQAPDGFYILEYTYDARGQLLSETSPAGEFAYRYDALGNLLNTTLPDGQSLGRLYYGSGHSHQIHVNGETLVDIERDTLHREVMRTQGALHSRYTYDNLGRLKQRSVRYGNSHLAPEVLQVRYQWDGQDNLVQRQSTKHFEAGTYCRKLSEQGLHRQSMQYDALGRIQEVREGTHIKQQFRYDRASNLLDTESSQHVSHRPLSPRAPLPGEVEQAINPDEAVLHNQIRYYRGDHFEYDDLGRLRYKKSYTYGEQWFYYDAEQRLSRIECVAGEPKPSHSLAQTREPITRQVMTFRYDPLGRRIQKTITTEQWQAAPKPIPPRTYRPKFRGDTSADWVSLEPEPTPPLIPPEPFTPYWNVLEDKTQVTDFLWSGMQMVQEYCQGIESRHHIQQYQQICHTYVYELGSYAPIARLTHKGRYALPQRWGDSPHLDKTTQTWRYYHNDVNGAPSYITNQAGELVWQDDVTLSGLSLSCLTPEHPEGFSEQPTSQHLDWRQMETLRYQGQYRDHESGLHYNTFRYFDPSLGRFTQPDPIGLAGGWNLYQYAPNPLSWVDPWGWSCWSMVQHRLWYSIAVSKHRRKQQINVAWPLQNLRYVRYPIDLLLSLARLYHLAAPWSV